ncbi:MAG: hypothetical protein K8T91_01225 [Planctomycetes bacterium]|nr:hypothetical protein [Planctomycetota bacterium]
MHPMLSALFPIESGLLGSSRPRPLSQRAEGVRIRELVALALCGIAAAVAASLPDFISKVPGHAILRPVLPILCGLALVPRRGSGTLMSLCSLGTLGTFQFLPAGLGRTGFGNVASLLALGPTLDLAMLYSGSGWRIYLRSIVAGIAANLVAWGVRIAAVALGWPGGGGGGSANWQSKLGSYVACGALAGLMGAVIWFRVSERRMASGTGGDASEPEPPQ